MQESKRQKQVGALLLQELSNIFQRMGLGMMDGGLISITGVKMTPDLLEARVYLSFFQVRDKSATLKKIEEAGWEIKRELATRVKQQLRRIPVVQYFLDDTLEHASKMDELFKKINEEGRPDSGDKGNEGVKAGEGVKDGKNKAVVNLSKPKKSPAKARKAAGNKSATTTRKEPTGKKEAAGKKATKTKTATNPKSAKRSGKAVTGKSVTKGKTAAKGNAGAQSKSAAKGKAGAKVKKAGKTGKGGKMTYGGSSSPRDGTSGL
jgi:ribosome-binding factor A